ncbi:hotdog fold thioesterase [Mixta intestinalis]|jgi:1,4-dihydroxy-2-naphthoyl-CoA hydrolase|uniref:1,4-dihydroxy-2-naphthoyl-CoA hydrolase n=1 Tax=Mixta intestinalis TaxID=1615494 RepID=A0A6P1PXJ7_9GAMM|nr:hotdog fold thioesterase [Mixta intestinalis]QHM70881.1 1,4-dihydroxy-2-naphthoyl-CoA hydrolase [Mixta intestinalis]
MAIWKRQATLAQINAFGADTMVAHLGIRVTALHDDGLEATMPVDARTRQPFGLLHGGASAALAETLGSMAGYLCTEGEETLVGLEINANHLRAVSKGEVRGRCRALHLGRTHQVWQIDIFDNDDRLCCSSRLTATVIRPVARG